MKYSELENGLSSLLFLSIPLMFELPIYVTGGFISLTISSVLFHIFPKVDLFGILDTSSVIYVCSCYSFTNPIISLSFSVLNILEKLLINKNSAFILISIWIFTFVYCTIWFNMYTILPILFSSFFYHYTYFINQGKWNNNIRLLWHYYNTLYIAINTPYKFIQN